MKDSFIKLCAAGREDRYAAFLQEVVTRTAHLIAFWQSVGFVHGVGNTDNFSVLGETIDYGCADSSFLFLVRCWCKVLLWDRVSYPC